MRNNINILSALMSIKKIKISKKVLFHILVRFLFKKMSFLFIVSNENI